MEEEPEEQQAQQTQESEEDRDPGGRVSRCTQGGNLSAGARRLETRCEAQVLGGQGGFRRSPVRPSLRFRHRTYKEVL